MPETQTTNPPTFESVMAALQEFHEKMNELRESQKETALQLKETDRMLTRHAKSANKRLGALTNLFGDLTEGMVAPKICEKFNEFGFSLT